MSFLQFFTGTHHEDRPFSLQERAMLSLLVLLGSGTVIFLFLREVFKPPHKRNSSKWRLPPGPKGLPIFGSILDVRKSPKELADLRRYGEMATLQLGSKTWVVLNSGRLVNELYNRKGSMTNGRPEYPVHDKLISRGNRSVLLPPAEWSEKRRVMHQLLSGSAMKKYAEFQDLESVQLLAEYLLRPQEWYLHNGRYSNSVIHRIAFGKRVLGLTPKLAAIFEVTFDFVMNGTPMNNIDCFPKLAKLPKPLQWWRPAAERIATRCHEVYHSYWDPIHKDILNGIAGPSLARDVLVGEETKYRGTAEEAMWLAGQVVEAGSDTTRASLAIALMAAIKSPEAFEKARAEIDLVCGAYAERLPTFDDQPRLNYVFAFIKELLRWRPLFTWTPEHLLTQDLEFEGYYFPKDTNFVLNHQAVNSNPDEFKDPDVFRPERWLDGHEQDILHNLHVFGGGRRVCVGYRLAQRSLFINIARIIYCFNITERSEFDISEVHLFAGAEPFPAKVSVRSAKHEQLILQVAEKEDVLRFAKGELTAAELED